MKKQCAYIGCGLEFEPSRPAQKYCSTDCGKAVRKEYLKTYAKENKEQIQENLDPDKRKKTNRKYFKKNRKSLLKRALEYRAKIKSKKQ